MTVTEYDKISLRAFQIWEAEGRPEGRDLEHWLRAEIELRVVPGRVGVKSPPALLAPASKAPPAKKSASAKPVAVKVATKAAKPVSQKRAKPVAKA